MGKAGGWIVERDYEIVRVADIPWEDRVNVDGWPSRAGLYWDDRENELCMRSIAYPVGSTEPRHVHAGSHATTVLEGRAIVDGLELGPLDVVFGPGGEPHGPLHYPEGCQLFSVFHGSYFHSEVGELAPRARYRLIRAATIPWERHAGGFESKTLLDRGVGRVLLRALRFAPGARLRSPEGVSLHAALLLEGGAEIGGEALGRWDFVRLSGATELEFPDGATLLAVSLRPAARQRQ
jgi:hypothetical protein